MDLAARETKEGSDQAETPEEEFLEEEFLGEEQFLDQEEFLEPGEELRGAEEELLDTENDDVIQPCHKRWTHNQWTNKDCLRFLDESSQDEGESEFIFKF